MSFFVNDWVELRADAFKICLEMQRPIPLRADSIGPWLDNISFLAWLGSITTSALVYLFRGDGSGPGGTPSSIHGWALLLTILCSEHLYLLVRLGVRTYFSKIDSPGRQIERRERFLVRKRYLEESIGEDVFTDPEPAPSGENEKITRMSLEDEARRESIAGYHPDERFWGRQRYWQETVKAGVGIIRKSGPKEGKKLL